MTITMSKEERISLRASAETKQLLQRAAELSGVSISEYVLSPARERAQHEILDQRFLLPMRPTSKRTKRGFRKSSPLKRHGKTNWA